MVFDYLIVGAGLYGATFAYFATQKGKKCLVVDKRPFLGGNVYCQNIQGINVHKYGAHIFHTNDKKVWNFVNSFVEFNRYTNCPIANYKGQIFNLPFNMNTFYQMWGVTSPSEAQDIINKQRQEENIAKVENLEQQAISLVGKDIYTYLIKEYTEKQWGRSCKDLPAFIIKRLPVRFTYDNNYFNDSYQGIPIGGYNKLIHGLLNGIECKTQVDFFANKTELEQMAKKIIFTGKIDEYYDYCFGKLDYRSISFETEVLPMDNFQGNAVVNYTSLDQPFTRIIEHKHFEVENPCYNEKITVISKEYPTEWKEGMEPFYPVNDEKNSQLYAKYKELSKKEKNVLFGGRLGEYKYYDMDDVISKAMKDAEEEIRYFKN